MELGTYIHALAPEWVMLFGACAVMLVGLARGGKAAGPLALGVTVLAFLLAVVVRPTDAGAHFPGLIVGGLLQYVRLGGLGVGILILLTNLHLPAAEERGEFFSMILFSLLGLLVTAAANDLIVLFFAIELVSVPTYVLVALSRKDVRASEAAVKYFFLGAMAAALMVYGFSFLYGSLGGTTVMTGSGATMAGYLARGGINFYATIGLLLAFAGIFFKLAAVPFHSYVADVYEGAAAPVTGLLGFLPKFAGLVAAVKLLSVFDWSPAPQVFWLLWIVAALTMTVGNTLALLQYNVKRILAYSSIAHSGYMLVALLAGPVAGAGPMKDGVAALLFYIVVYGAMNLGAFAVLAALARRGEPAEELADIEGLSTRHPALALGMAICVFSLMGFPPTAGLLGKVYIFSSAFSVSDSHAFGGPLVVLAVIGVINSAIGAAYYLRIVSACYVHPERAERGESQRVGGPAVGWAIALCSIAMLIAFVWPRGITGRAGEASASVTPDKPQLAASTPTRRPQPD